MCAACLIHQRHCQICARNRELDINLPRPLPRTQGAPRFLLYSRVDTTMDSLCYYTHSQTEPINKGLEPIYPSSTSWDPIDTGDIHHPASFTPQSVQYNSFSQDATATESQDSFSQDDLASVSQHTHSELGAGDSSMQDTICGINL